MSVILDWTYDTILSCDGSQSTDDKSYDTNLAWPDFMVLGFTVIVAGILLAHMFPCCPGWRRCDHMEYPGIHLETYQDICRLHGVDPSSKKSKSDHRTIDKLLLKHDLLYGKLVWHGEYYRDFFCFLRLEHPMLSLLYGHTMHSYNLSERRFAFIGIQFVAVGLAVILQMMLSYLFYYCNLQDSNEGFKWFIGFTFDLLFGIILSSVSNWYYLAATCECARTCNDCCRKLIYKIGHLAMLIMLVFSFGFCVYVNVVFYIFELSWYDNQFAIIVTFGINYFTGLFLSWFFIDLITMWIAFNKEWKIQMGIRQPFCDDCCCGVFARICNLTRCCIASWCCGCCICYYCCCDITTKGVSYLNDESDHEMDGNNNNNNRDNIENQMYIERKNENKNKKIKIRKRHYPTDGKGNVIGSYKGEFGITWQDYQNYVNKKAIEKRDLKLLIEKTMGGEDIGLVDNIELQIASSSNNNIEIENNDNDNNNSNDKNNNNDNNMDNKDENDDNNDKNDKNDKGVNNENNNNNNNNVNNEMELKVAITNENEQENVIAESDNDNDQETEQNYNAMNKDSNENDCNDENNDLNNDTHDKPRDQENHENHEMDDDNADQ